MKEKRTFDLNEYYSDSKFLKEVDAIMQEKKQILLLEFHSWLIN
ncbi:MULTISPECIES: hypothetical protein [unclassified Flavobacterium]|nr:MULTISPECIES: hypothetical protein [unclassified Flavobacterium]